MLDGRRLCYSCTSTFTEDSPPCMRVCQAELLQQINGISFNSFMLPGKSQHKGTGWYCWIHFAFSWCGQVSSWASACVHLCCDRFSESKSVTHFVYLYVLGYCTFGWNCSAGLHWLKEAVGHGPSLYSNLYALCSWGMQYIYGASQEQEARNWHLAALVIIYIIMVHSAHHLPDGDFTDFHACFL